MLRCTRLWIQIATAVVRGSSSVAVMKELLLLFRLCSCRQMFLYGFRTEQTSKQTFRDCLLAYLPNFQDGKERVIDFSSPHPPGVIHGASRHQLQSLLFPQVVPKLIRQLHVCTLFCQLSFRLHFSGPNYRCRCKLIAMLIARDYWIGAAEDSD